MKGCPNIFGSAWYDEKFAFYDANLSRYSFKENGVKHAFDDFNKNAIKPSARVGTSSSSDPKPSTRLHEPHEELHGELGKQPLAPVTFTFTFSLPASILVPIQLSLSLSNLVCPSPS